jgi:hypothetical protein
MMNGCFMSLSRKVASTFRPAGCVFRAPSFLCSFDAPAHAGTNTAVDVNHGRLRLFAPLQSRANAEIAFASDPVAQHARQSVEEMRGKRTFIPHKAIPQTTARITSVQPTLDDVARKR